MEELFIHILNISITASFLVLAIIFYRIFAKKAPKWISVLLWGLVGLRLLLPFSIESAMSLIPSKNTIPTTIATDRFPSLDTGFESIDEIVNPFISNSMEARPEYSANPVQIRLTVLGWIWIAVTLCMLLYMLASFIYLRMKTRIKLKIDDNAYLCDYVKTPFILGIIKPRIYLPSDICTEYRSHVISHERAHIKRLDHIWKPIGFMLLSVYWFNPLLWIAYVLLCRDIECACDEKVISDLDAEEKATYADSGKIETLYELKFNETLPTYLYTMKFIASDSVNTSLMLYTNNGMGRIIFGDNLNYESLGTYKYENSKLIFKTTDSFELTLVFLDVGNALIYSESESDTKGFDNLLSDGVSFNGYYQLYRAFSATKAFDIDGDGKLEVIYANISSDGTLYYIIHRYKTIHEGTYALKEAYDSLSFEIENGSLYLICEYSDTDFGLYRYKVDYDGAELTFNMEK